MGTFTGNTDVPALDAVTVISILEHCELEETLVEYFRVNPRNGMPIQRWVCLRCLCQEWMQYLSGDGRVELMEAVQKKHVHVLQVKPRGDTPCQRCGLLRALVP